VFGNTYVDAQTSKQKKDIERILSNRVIVVQNKSSLKVEFDLRTRDALKAKKIEGKIFYLLTLSSS
jgi:hypothetical protein